VPGLSSRFLVSTGRYPRHQRASWRAGAARQPLRFVTIPKVNTAMPCGYVEKIQEETVEPTLQRPSLQTRLKQRGLGFFPQEMQVVSYLTSNGLSASVCHTPMKRDGRSPSRTTRSKRSSALEPDPSPCRCPRV
jgi:hypothetical protein